MKFDSIWKVFLKCTCFESCRCVVLDFTRHRPSNSSFFLRIMFLLTRNILEGKTMWSQERVTVSNALTDSHIQWIQGACLHWMLSFADDVQKFHIGDPCRSRRYPHPGSGPDQNHVGPAWQPCPGSAASHTRFSCSTDHCCLLREHLW